MSECEQFETVAVINHDGKVRFKNLDWIESDICIDKYKDHNTVEKWSNTKVQWILEAKFETLEEAIMYGITLV